MTAIDLLSSRNFISRTHIDLANNQQLADSRVDARAIYDEVSRQHTKALIRDHGRAYVARDLEIIHREARRLHVMNEKAQYFTIDRTRVDEGSHPWIVFDKDATHARFNPKKTKAVIEGDKTYFVRDPLKTATQIGHVVMWTIGAGFLDGDPAMVRTYCQMDSNKFDLLFKEAAQQVGDPSMKPNRASPKGFQKMLSRLWGHNK